MRLHPLISSKAKLFTLQKTENCLPKIQCNTIYPPVEHIRYVMMI